MKRKILILIPLLFILCGCTAEVNIEIDDKKINEIVSIDAYSDGYYTKNQLLTAFRKYIPIYEETTIVDTMPDEKVNGVLYYNRTEKDLGSGYRFTYDYNFNFDNYKKARTVKGAFKSSNIQYNKKDQEILVSTDNSEILYFNQYPSLTKISINIKSKYKVKESNADSVTNNVYTWNFDKNTKKNIYMLLDTTISTPNQEDNSSNDTNENKTSKKNNEVEEESEFIKFINEHPIIVAIASVTLFIIVVSIVSKLTKNKY